MPLVNFKPRDNPAFVTRVSEEKLESLSFTVSKFNARIKPPRRDRIIIVSCFSEFGCEILGSLYCIPRLLKRFPGRYVIVMGWYGREYLYKHLVDEFWEVKEDFMWLRDHTRAFHHISDNLKRAEEAASRFGTVVPAEALGKFLVGNYCKSCGKYWHDWINYSNACPSCNSTYIIRSFLTDTAEIKKTARRIPAPSADKLAWAQSLLKGPTVGVFARARKTYGRNLPPEFYVKLIALIRSMGWDVIWLGEKQNTLPCPVDDVLDFSRCPESRDLERTLAIVKQLKFTIQFWTASTRLAGLMGTPFILFESPEQIYSTGLNPAQEGKRLELTSFGPKKVIISHYFNVLNNQDAALELIPKAVQEMKLGNYEDMVGLVEEPEVIRLLRDEYYERLR